MKLVTVSPQASPRSLLPLLLVAAVLSIAPAPAGASHGAQGTPVLTRLNLPTNDLVFDPVSSKIYASIPSRAGLLGNRVVAIDPATGAVGPSVFVGSEPGRMAVSANGQYLYVVLNGAAAVRRVDLPSLTAGLQFSLGGHSFFGPHFVEDIDVSPADPGTVAVSRMYEGTSPRHAGVAIHVDGSKLPDETPGHTGANQIEFGLSGTRLYGSSNESGFGFRRLTVGASGVTILDGTGLNVGFGLDMEFDDGLAYGTSGVVVDAETRTLLGTYPVSSAGAVEPDTTHGKVYFVSAGTLSEFDQDTFVFEQSFPIAGMSGTPSSLVEIGDGDLAFRTSGDQVFLVRFQAGTDTTPPGIGVLGNRTAEASGPNGAVVEYPVAITSESVGESCSPSSGSLFPIGITYVFCNTWDAAGNVSVVGFTVTVVGPSPSVTPVSLATKDIVYDPSSETIYASVPSSGGPLGNRIVAIDPATGAIGSSVFVGSEPGKLALSADGQFLYVALDGAAAVRRVALPALTAGLQFSLGTHPQSGPNFAEDIAVVPNDAGTVAVSRRSGDGGSPRHRGVAMYDDGVKLQDETPEHTGSNVIEYGSSSTRVYGYNNESTEFGFRRLTVGASGVSNLDVTNGIITGFGTDIEFDDGRVYATTGRVVDAEARTVAGTFTLGTFSAAIEPSSASGTAHFMSSGTLLQFDQAAFTPIQSFPIAGVSGTPSSLVETGTGLAFRTTANQVFIVNFQDGTSAPGPSIAVPDDAAVDATGPDGAVVTYSIGGSGEVACAPASATVFPIGATTVTCTAPNRAAGSFHITVVGTGDPARRAPG